MTLRLYYTDSYLTKFDATVLAVEPHGDRLAVILDRSAFYPTSGGQPHDTGTLGGLPVTEVIEDDEDRVLHVVSGPITGIVTGGIRVVDVEEFDRSACGGTHVRRTGEIGTVKLRRWERFKGGVRVEFLCGWRALRDSRWKNALVGDLAAKLSVKDQEVAQAIERLAAQVRERDRTLAGLRDQLIELEAQRRLGDLPGTPRIVADVLTGWSAEMTSALAGRLAAAGSTIAAFGTSDGRVFIARSPDLELDVAGVLRRAVEPLGGRGGGRPTFAQGAVLPEKVGEAVTALRAEVHRVLDVKL